MTKKPHLDEAAIAECMLRMPAKPHEEMKVGRSAPDEKEKKPIKKKEIGANLKQRRDCRAKSGEGV